MCLTGHFILLSIPNQLFFCLFPILLIASMFPQAFGLNWVISMPPFSWKPQIVCQTQFISTLQCTSQLFLFSIPSATTLVCRLCYYSKQVNIGIVSYWFSPSGFLASSPFYGHITTRSIFQSHSFEPGPSFQQSLNSVCTRERAESFSLTLRVLQRLIPACLPLPFCHVFMLNSFFVPHSNWSAAHFQVHIFASQFKTFFFYLECCFSLYVSWNTITFVTSYAMMLHPLTAFSLSIWCHAMYIL